MNPDVVIRGFLSTTRISIVVNPAIHEVYMHNECGPVATGIWAQKMSYGPAFSNEDERFLPWAYGMKPADYNIISIVRNPWHRALASYVGLGIHKMGVPFSLFVRGGRNNTYNKQAQAFKNSLWKHWQSQVWFAYIPCGDENIKYAKALRYESFIQIDGDATTEMIKEQMDARAAAVIAEKYAHDAAYFDYRCPAEVGFNKEGE